MATTTIKMGKRGTIVLPAKLRKQFGLGDGSLLVTDDGSNSIWRISYTGTDSQQRERNDASQPVKTTSR